VSTSTPPPVRSALFVPAIRRAWIEKAPGYGADTLVLDLEDATPPGDKAEAREIVRELLPALHEQGQTAWARVNAGDELPADIEAVCREGLCAICLPKVRGPDDIEELDRLLAYAEGRNGLPFGSIRIVPLLETAEALHDPARVFAASPRVAYAGGLAAPGADVEFAVGSRWTPSFTESLHFRSAALLAGRACGIHNPLTGLVTDLDADLVARFAEQGRDIGYEGMFVIHPTHVPVANEAFAPTDEEYAWSQEVLDGFAGQLDGGRGAILDSQGRMIDIAMLRVAERVASRYRTFRPAR
jgi:citrate lyase subunit beta/citryl-CoA lyase